MREGGDGMRMGGRGEGARGWNEDGRDVDMEIHID